MRSEGMNEFTMSGPAWFDEQPEAVLWVREGRVEYCNPAAAAHGIAQGAVVPPAVVALMAGEGPVEWQGTEWDCICRNVQDGVLIRLMCREKRDGVSMVRLGELAQSLRKPLSDVFGAVQLLSRRKPEESPAEKYLAIGSKGCHALLRMVENMEAVADAGHRDYAFQLIDLGGLCARIVRETEGLVELAGCSISLDVQGGNFLIYGDDYWLRRIIYQLVSNALRSTGAGGSLVLRLRKRSGTEKWAVLTLSDSGKGFDESVLESAFDPGSRAGDPMAPATGQGLGLVVCQSVVAAHGGSMMLGSGQGGGAVIQLPLKELEGQLTLRTGVDYSGGVNEALVQLSDALPWQCYLEQNQ